MRLIIAPFSELRMHRGINLVCILRSECNAFCLLEHFLWLLFFGGETRLLIGMDCLFKVLSDGDTPCRAVVNCSIKYVNEFVKLRT